MIYEISKWCLHGRAFLGFCFCFSDEIVALKRLKMEKEREGFPITSLREINTLLKAQHPNIVTVRVSSFWDSIIHYSLSGYVATPHWKVSTILIEPKHAFHGVWRGWWLLFQCCQRICWTRKNQPSICPL